MLKYANCDEDHQSCDCASRERRKEDEILEVQSKMKVRIYIARQMVAGKPIQADEIKNEYIYLEFSNGYATELAVKTTSDQASLLRHNSSS